MSFRLRIVLITTTLILALFSIGGAVFVHITFEASLEKEEQAAVEENEMLLRTIELVGEHGAWFTEFDLISVINKTCEENATDSYLLEYDVNDSYVKNQEIVDHFNKITNLERNKVAISYFRLDTGEKYLQTSTQFYLNGRRYFLDMGKNLSDIYQMRDEQISIFQKTFIALFAISAILSWALASLKESAARQEMFMGAFAHEMKTPMTSIIGYADLLRTQNLSEEDKEDALSYIFSEAKRLENLSLKMLDLFVADKKKIILRECHPSELTLHVVNHLQSAYEKSDIKLEVNAEEGIFFLEPDLFQSLLINLLDNAKKAMTNAGTIRISVEVTDNVCKLSVADTGKGIPEASIKHITERFYRVDKARARSEGNAGLGLALCEKIVQLHHGTMHFESTEGVGTTVTVYLKGGPHEKI